VFWVHASNAARFEEAYRDIANRLQLPGRDHPTANVLQLVYNWLCSASSGKWIIIVDNADDWSVFYPRREHEGSSGDSSNVKNTTIALARFLPQSTNGSVLITSRSLDVATKLSGSNKDIIKIYTMNEDQAVQLLENKLSGPSYEKAELTQLALALDRVPLAIVQAAAYINRRAPRTSVSKYVMELGMSDQKRERLLNEGGSYLYRDEYASNSVLTTWQISFEYIRQERSSAAELLSFMSFFNAQGIPEFMLYYYSQDRDSIEELGQDRFEEDVDLLRSYSLVNVKGSGDIFEMHRLVQLSTRIWLRSVSEEEKWRGIFLSAVYKEFPTGDFVNWAKCQSLLPHIEGIKETIPDNDEKIGEWVGILANAAWYLWTQGLYGQAEGLIKKSVAEQGKISRSDDISVFRNQSIYALVLSYEGKYEESEALNRRALAGYEKALGVDHPSTLTSVSNLAYLLYNMK
jgi:hypothetical protein